MAVPGPVVTLGEAMLLATGPFGAADALPDALTDELVAAGSLAGAEANVAVGLAGLGIPVSWLGRLGDDAAGRKLLGALAGAGVDVGGVRLDSTFPTGWYAKRVGSGPDGQPRTEMAYRRKGSAAAAMTPEFATEPAVAVRLERAGLVHLTGITPALSAGCAALVGELLRRPRTAPVTFDVNWREQLWPDGDPGLLVELAGLADVVLVGADEAERVFGTADPAELRTMLPGPDTLLIKDGAVRALAVDRTGGIVEVPALTVEVVEPVGAGDAFCAGYLAGLVRGEAQLRCLRRGHAGAAAALTTHGDSAAHPDPGLLDRLLSLPTDQWDAVRVDATGFHLPG